MTTVKKPQMLQMLRVRELAAVLNVSQRHIWRMESSGKLPKSVRIGECRRWLSSDIETWLKMGCPSQKQFEVSKATQR